MFTPNSNIEALTANVTVFRDRALEEVLRLNQTIRVGCSSRRADALLRKGRHQECVVQREGLVSTR